MQRAWDYIKGYGAGLLSPVQVGVVDTGLYAGNGQFDGGVKSSYTDPAAQRNGPEFVSEPFDMQITYVGNTITFMMGSASQGASTSMSGNVIGQSGDWYIDGVFTASETGLSVKATWRVTR